MNEQSSRSHRLVPSLIRGFLPLSYAGPPWALLNLHKFTSNTLEICSLFIMTIHQKLRDGSTRVGKLNLADLAGIHLPPPLIFTLCCHPLQ